MLPEGVSRTIPFVCWPSILPSRGLLFSPSPAHTQTYGMSAEYRPPSPDIVHRRRWGRLSNLRAFRPLDSLPTGKSANRQARKPALRAGRPPASARGGISRSKKKGRWRISQPMRPGYGLVRDPAIHHVQPAHQPPCGGVLAFVAPCPRAPGMQNKGIRCQFPTKSWAPLGAQLLVFSILSRRSIHRSEVTPAGWGDP